MKIVLEFLRAAVDGSAPVFATQEYARHPLRDFTRHFPQRQHLSGASRTFDLEVLAQIVMKLLQRFDQQEVDREPDGAAPVRIAAEQPRARFRRLVIHAMLHPINLEDIWILVMETRDGADRSEEHTSELQSLRQLVCR